MKSPVAVATIVAGTVILLVPYVSNAIGTAIVASTIARIGKGVDLTGSMPGWYDGACFFTGILMVLVGIGSSLRREA
jgi:hypothetical protein